MRIVILSFFLALSTISNAQNTSWVINPGQSLFDVLGPADFVRYPGFPDAVVRFKDGYLKRTGLNYSYIEAALQFLSPKGDTMVLEGLEELDYAAIGTDTFVFRPYTFERLASYAPGELLRRQYLRSDAPTKVGGYDSNEPGGAVDAVTRVNASNQVRSLTAGRERITVIRQSDIYISKKGGEPELATRKSIDLLFPKLKTHTADYLKSTPVDFHNGAQVKALLDYLAALK